MSDTIDECRAWANQQRHERGDCGIGCSYCDDPAMTCAICHEPIELDIADESHNLCKACWAFEVVGLDG